MRTFAVILGSVLIEEVTLGRLIGILGLSRGGEGDEAMVAVVAELALEDLRLRRSLVSTRTDQAAGSA